MGRPYEGAIACLRYVATQGEHILVVTASLPSNTAGSAVCDTCNGAS